MKIKMKKIIKRIKAWNDFWVFVEQERMNAMKYCGKGFW